MPITQMEKVELRKLDTKFNNKEILAFLEALKISEETIASYKHNCAHPEYCSDGITFDFTDWDTNGNNTQAIRIERVKDAANEWSIWVSDAHIKQVRAERDRIARILTYISL